MQQAANPDSGAMKSVQILGVSTVAFTVYFAVWSIFSIIGIGIKQQLGLDDTEFGLLIGTPILSGSLIRLALAVWSAPVGYLGRSYQVVRRRGGSSAARGH